MVGVQPNTIKGEGKSSDTEKTPSLTLFGLFVTHHVLELHNCPKNLECELSFSTGTFLIERLLLVGICSTVRKGPKRTWDTTVETTKINKTIITIFLNHRFFEYQGRV